MDKEAPVFDYTAENIGTLAGKAIADFEADVKNLADLPGEKRTFANTVLAFERAVGNLSEAVNIPVILAYVSDNAEVRKAAQELELKINQYSVDIYTREDIFNALTGYAAKNEKLGEVESRLLAKTLLDFKKNGLGLEPRKKNKVKKLLKALVELELQFSKNLREVTDSVEVTEEELKGLPQDYIERLKKTPDGKYTVTMNYPDYIPFMDNAESDGARKRLEAVFNNRCAAQNLKLMEDAIALRRKTAKLIGYPNFADYMLDDRMAKNSATVMDFLGRTWAKLKKKGRKELRQRAKLKNKKTGGADITLNAWEWRYYNNQLKKEKYALDHEKIKEYFPLETVIGGMFGIFGRVLAVKFEPADLSVWHKDVRAFSVRNADGSLAAYFYFDLFPRDGKYKHAACFALRRGRELSDGSYALPAAAIVANFPGPSGGAPSLMKFDDVVTLFHEFGHVTHQLLTKAKYCKFSGTSVSRDFVEVPSKIFENWAYYGEVLKAVSGHYKNPAEKLPDKLIKKLIDTKNMDSGLVYLRQLFFSLLDMKYHMAKGKADTTRLYGKMMKKISLIPMSEGTHPQASFGHLMGGYEAGYYSYLWSEVIAADLFSVFQEKGVMDPETGARYRELILAPGRSYDEAGQVEKFLGRASAEDAFLKSIGAA
ncbi:MAG: Zn-dependent oligopeptidase [Elusimicrobia bacterium]|nr:Zn-dependent oligopeptidase [Elusimicrobiota bacterium]